MCILATLSTFFKQNEHEKDANKIRNEKKKQEKGGEK